MSWRERIDNWPLFAVGSTLTLIGLAFFLTRDLGGFLFCIFGGVAIFRSCSSTRDLKTYTISSFPPNSPRIWKDTCPLTASEMIYLFKIWFARARMATMMMASAYIWLEENGDISLSVVKKEVENLFLGFRYRTRHTTSVHVTSKDQTPRTVHHNWRPFRNLLHSLTRAPRIRDFSLENKIMTHLTGDADRDSVYSLTREVIGRKSYQPKKIIEKNVLLSMVGKGYIRERYGILLHARVAEGDRIISRMDELEEFIDPTKGLISVYRERNPVIFHQLFQDINKAFSAQTLPEYSGDAMDTWMG